MRSRTISGLVMAGLLLLVPASARSFEPDADKAAPKVAPSRPALRIRLAPLDDLIGDLRYVVKKLVCEEEGKQIEEMLEASTGPKGLKGVDTKKPIGLVGYAAKRFDLLFLLPIADEKTFMSFLKDAGVAADKDEDGSYSMSLGNLPFVFRFANGYLYGMLSMRLGSPLPAADKLPKPDAALGAGTGVMSLDLNLDAVPPAVRKVIIPPILQPGWFKDLEMPGATEKQKALRNGALDESMRIVRQLVEDGGSVRGQLDLDRKADALGLALHVDGPKGSTLARDIRSLGARTSLGPAIIAKDSVMGGYINLPIPAALRRLLDPVIDELFDKASKDRDDAVKALLKPSIDALKPTLKADSIAMAADICGPGKSGKYSLVASARLVAGEALEKAVKDLVAKIPAESNHIQFKTDVAKAGGVDIHEFTLESQTAQAVELFGKAKVFAAVRKDAVFVTAGDAGLDKIKTTLAVKPAEGKLLHLQLAMSKAGIFGEMHPKDTKALTDKAFGGKVGDKVSLTLDGGDKLDLRLAVDLAVLKFAYLMWQERKEK